MSLNLFPPRIPIGKVTLPDGAEASVTASVEFLRALRDLFQRVGGPSGWDNQSLALLAELGPAPATSGAQEAAAALGAMNDSAAQLSSLRAEIDALREEVGMLQSFAAVSQQVEELRAMLGMMEDPGAAVRYLLACYAPLDSPVFTGTPAAPTAAADTNTTQLATTAYVIGQASATNPLMDGVAAIGTSKRYARGDHVHPTDTSRQATITPGTATGSRGGNAALASLLSALATSGLVVDSTSA